MRALRRSPLFRIALLSLAVLFAHTGRAATAQPITPLRPPCPGKVAAAQPDPQKKLISGSKRAVRPGRPVHGHSLFGNCVGFTHACAASSLFGYSAGQITPALWTVATAPQRRQFVLRI